MAVLRWCLSWLGVVYRPPEVAERTVNTDRCAVSEPPSPPLSPPTPPHTNTATRCHLSASPSPSSSFLSSSRCCCQAGEMSGIVFVCRWSDQPLRSSFFFFAAHNPLLPLMTDSQEFDHCCRNNYRLVHAGLCYRI